MKTSKQLISLVALLLLSSCAIRAQRKDTIYQTLATNYISSSATGDTWGPVTNIGQGYHQAYLSVSSQTGKSCLSGTTNPIPSVTAIQFLVTPPGQSSIEITNGAAGTQYTFTNVGTGKWNTQIVSAATSIFPFVFVKVTGIDIANCQYSLIYSGSLYPVAPTPLTVSQPWNSGSVHSNGLLQQIFQLSTSGANTIGDASFLGIGSTTVYGMVISNTTGPQNVQIKCGSTVLENFSGLTTGQVIVLPITGSAYMSCLNSLLTANLTNATAVDINLIYQWQ